MNPIYKVVYNKDVGYDKVEGRSKLEFICEFDPERTELFTRLGISYKVPPQTYLSALFYEDKETYEQECSPYDWDRSSPESPIKVNLRELYEMIASTISRLSTQTDEDKEIWIVDGIIPFIKYEFIKPKVREIIDNYLKQNSQYKYCRII